MKKKCFAAFLLSSSFFLLTGFDSDLTIEEIFEKSAQTDHSSVHGEAALNASMDFAYSSDEESAPSLSGSLIFRMNAVFEALEDSSMYFDTNIKYLAPGTQEELSVCFYRVPIFGFQNYLYDSSTAQWDQIDLLQEEETLIKQVIDDILHDSLPSSFATSADAVSDDISDEPETYYQLFEKFDSSINYSDIFTVSPDPVTINGISCYELTGDFSYADLNLDLFIDTFLDLYTDDFYFEDDAEKEEYLDFVKKHSIGIANSVTLHLSIYIDDSTFNIVQTSFEAEGLDYSEFITELMRSELSDSSNLNSTEIESVIPSMTVSFPTFEVTISYVWDEVEEISLPLEVILNISESEQTQ